MSETGQENLQTSPKEAETAQVNIGDLIFLEKESLGLRHVPNKTTAWKELSEGIYGDALAIGSIRSLIDPEKTDDKGVRLNILPFAYSSLFFTPEEQRELVNRYRESVIGFLNESIEWDADGQAREGDTVRGFALRFAEEGGAFLIAKFQGANSGYDNTTYFGIGKCGKQHVKAGDVKGLVELTKQDVVNNKKIAEITMDNKGYQDLRRSTGETLFTKFVGQIKSMQTQA